MKRYNLSSSFLGVVLSAKIAFSQRSWPYLAACAVPWLLCAGQRCVTRLAKWGSHRRSLSGYYRFLSDGKWRTEVFFKCLFDLIVRTFRTPDLTLVLDDTLSPKWGRGIFGTAFHFDHTARPRAGYIWGHNWVVLAVVVQVGTRAWVALPFWVALYRPKKTCPRGRFRTRHEMAAEVLGLAEGWLRARGLKTLRGPVSPSMNDECGLLVAGFDRPPMAMMPYNPESYAGLLESPSLCKCKDLYAYLIEGEEARPGTESGDRLVRLVGALRRATKPRRPPCARSCGTRYRPDRAALGR